MADTFIPPPQLVSTMFPPRYPTWTADPPSLVRTTAFCTPLEGLEGTFIHQAIDWDWFGANNPFTLVDWAYEYGGELLKLRACPLIPVVHAVL